MDTSHEIFISCATEDSDIAKRACEAIESDGVRCWIAPRDIKTGENYPKAIIKAIRKSRILVLISSENAMKSDHVASEVLEAFNRKLHIINFRIEDVAPTEQMVYLLGSKNWLDAFDTSPDDYLDKLVTGVQNLLAVDEELDPDDIGEFKSVFVRDSIFKTRRFELRSLTIYFIAILLAFFALKSITEKLGDILVSNTWLPIVGAIIPLVVIFPEAFGQFQRRRRKNRMQREGKSGKIKDPEYFRTFPYDSIPHYMKVFRHDKAHEKVLHWIRNADDPLLFLSGHSGTGKTSILNAYVCPELEKQETPVKTITIRSFGDPLDDLKSTLAKLGIETNTGDDADIRSILEKAVKENSQSRLLIIFDQFEELLIIHESKPERLEQMKELFTSLVSKPIDGLTVLLAFRTDYMPLLEDFDLPPLTTRKNWFDVCAFTETHARQFLRESNLKFSDETIDTLFEQIAAFEGTKGLVRPIILNMVGLIAMKTGESSAIQKKQTENLLVEYLSHHLYQREMKDHAPSVLENMVTEVGTKTPRSIDDLADQTGLPKSEIKGTLNLLANSGLVRLIDMKEQVWEVAHDFIAHHLLIVIRGRKRSTLGAIAPMLAPIALILWGIVIFGLLPPYIANLHVRKAYELIGAAGGKITQNDDGEMVFYCALSDSEHLHEAIKHLNKLPNLIEIGIICSSLSDEDLENLGKLTFLKKLSICVCNLVDENLAYLSGLTSLEELRLDDNELLGEGIKYLSGLQSLRLLSLRGNRINGKYLEYVGDLESLEGLYLNGNNIQDADIIHLNPLTGLKTLYLRNNNISDVGLAHLTGLKNLRVLSLDKNPISNEGLVHLKEFTSLTWLRLGGNRINDAGFYYLQSLKSLITLWLWEVEIGDLGFSYLSKLKSLRVLGLGKCRINCKGPIPVDKYQFLEYLVMGGCGIGDDDLRNLRNLQSLVYLSLSNNSITDSGLENIAGLTKLENLELDGNDISDSGLEHLAGLRSLKTLALDSNRICGEGLKYLIDLTSLQMLSLRDNNIKDEGFVHLLSLKSLRDLDIEGNPYTYEGILKLGLSKQVINLKIKAIEAEEIRKGFGWNDD